MTEDLVQISVHPSQWPERVHTELLESLRTRRINHKFHYQSLRQARHWLRLHQTYSPALRHADGRQIYDRAFAEAAPSLGTGSLQLIGLGCGHGGKECRLLERMPDAAERASFVAVDVSWPLALIARQSAARLLPDSHCHAVVCDLGTAGDLTPEFDRLAGKAHHRMVTFFGVIPNFEPQKILPQLAALLHPGDRLLFSANLVPEGDYDAGIRRILPQYDNASTREWLFLLLADLGIEHGDGTMDCLIEPDRTGQPLARIAIYFTFHRPRIVVLDDQEFRFEREDRLRLFFSYRHTPSGIRSLLAHHGITVESESITASGEEGVFTCRRCAPSRED